MRPILSNNYYVNFQEDAYKKLNGFVASYNPSTIFVLVDENTNENCLPILLQQLECKATIENLKIIII